MKKGDNLPIILFASMFSGRLGAFQALDTTRQRYSIGKAVYTGYNVSVSIKDIKNSPASFCGGVVGRTRKIGRGMVPKNGIA